jgi:uncharacterized coiled-coil protein SlyX
MSAALRLPLEWEPSVAETAWQIAHRIPEQESPTQANTQPAKIRSTPAISLAFYRKHTESLLKRYLYASMQVGRAPSILSDPVARGWASSRPVRTFEDAVIFVLDIEKCLSGLGSLDRELLSRIALQEYTQEEVAAMLGMTVRAVAYRFQLALDSLTEKLLEADLLVIPH